MKIELKYSNKIALFDKKGLYKTVQFPYYKIKRLSKGGKEKRKTGCT